MKLLNLNRKIILDKFKSNLNKNKKFSIDFQIEFQVEIKKANRAST